MIIFVDIDGTICNNTYGKYKKAQPISENIEKINQLYDEGNTIVYWTARGSRTKIDWHELTTKQLEEWGAKHHNLIIGKPHYDLYIDDKSINSKVFFKEKGE